MQLEDVECELFFNETRSVEMVELADCACVLVVFSLTCAPSLEEAKFFLQLLHQSGDLLEKVVILVGNKTDLVRKREVATEGLFHLLFMILNPILGHV